MIYSENFALIARASLPANRLRLIAPLVAVFAGFIMMIVAAPAMGFSAMVSPPRFELSAKPGQTLREVLEISHADSTAGGYRFATADWTLAADGSVSFTEALAANSCRPWVAIERRSANLPANGRMKFRVEINVPADAPPSECRFALLVQGDDQVVRSGALPVPVAGRIGVIFYVLVGGAAPKLNITPNGVHVIDQVSAPVVKVSNIGNGHGRLGGVLTAVDAKGQKFELVPTSMPILAGETRDVPLMPNAVGGGPANPTLPLRVSGKIEWGDTTTLLEHEFGGSPQ